MVSVYEHNPDQPLKPGEVDGMAEFLDEDDVLSTDWDLEIEGPPHDFLKENPATQ